MMLARLGSSRLSSVRIASSAASRRAFATASVSRAPALSAQVVAVTTVAAAATGAFVATPSPAQCHCQIPCGIFDDPARVVLLKEHAATIRKAMAQLHSIAASSAPSGEQFDSQSFNQAARWVAVKEEAASEIIKIVSEYMLCQRVKRASFDTVEEYRRALELHHVLMQSAMKAKQTVDALACDALDHSIADVGVMYIK